MRSNISYRPYANVDYEKIYKKVVEMDPSMEEFIDEVREIELPEDEEIQQLEAGLRKKDKKATERLIELYTRYAVRLVGFANVSYFCRSFREYYGSSPESNRKGTGEDEQTA